MYSSHQKGEIGQIKVSLRAIEKGFRPSRPLIESRYDLVVDDGDKLHRVQIKYADQKHDTGAVEVDLRKQCYHNGVTKRYCSDEVDAIIVYLPKTDKCYWIPKEVFEGRAAFKLRLEAPKNNQKKTVTLAADYEW